ncbi:LysR family transcriptional regulator [Pontivivens ytuae]|uniref:LysR family transcriptional regulator n=1 Tax=Pontivivens ytuae TaxID=2789856 RepID=UPI001E54189E|nr:LysR family transcriptional regulator [Pontivivens ytuae]
MSHRLGRLDLNLISALVVLIEERSTTAAAKRLNLAQSTVSGILARLRDVFDDDLLVREGRGLVPTSRAEELLAAAKPHLDALAASLGEVQEFNPAEDIRIFRLGCTDAVAMAILPQLTETLRREAPHCGLTVRIGITAICPACFYRTKRAWLWVIFATTRTRQPKGAFCATRHGSCCAMHPRLRSTA